VKRHLLGVLKTGTSLPSGPRSVRRRRSLDSRMSLTQFISLETGRDASETLSQKKKRSGPGGEILVWPCAKTVYIKRNYLIRKKRGAPRPRRTLGGKGNNPRARELLPLFAEKGNSWYRGSEAVQVIDRGRAGETQRGLQVATATTNLLPRGDLSAPPDIKKVLEGEERGKGKPPAHPSHFSRRSVLPPQNLKEAKEVQKAPQRVERILIQPQGTSGVPADHISSPLVGIRNRGTAFSEEENDSP